ncbi:MAG: RHS repeat-associated core domain-containing protein [Candidatus Electrothrix communis]|nr:MAG: RHS repeat-associated core domain-containing protein [Candidatus Electrothrix communis]
MVLQAVIQRLRIRECSLLNKYNTATISQYDYTHDDIGRRKTMTTSGDAFSVSLPVPPDQKLVNTGTYTSVGYTPDNLNRYSEVNTNGSAVSPAYDDDGGLTDDGTFTYSWNGENRLITITPKTPAVGDKKLEFLYDYMGRRVRKVTTAWDGSTWQSDETRFFVYDGWNLIEELDGAGSTTASYVHGLDLSQSLQGAGSIGGILARVDHGTDKVHLYFYDANGNVGQLLDSADGSVVAAYEYAPFGGMTSAMGSYAETNPFRFSSKYADDTTGLYYYGYRYYSPDTGRWLSRDPIGEDGGVNLYGFIVNNPISYIDAFGHESIKQKMIDTAYDAGSEAYIAAQQSADLFNRAVFFPLLDLLSLPDEVLKCVFGVTDDDLTAFAAQVPGKYDDLFLGVIVGGTKVPKLAKKILGYVPAEGFIDPSKVKFTQDSIGATFKNGQSIDDVARQLRSAGGDELAKKFPQIRLVEKDGMLYTLDNRRLATFSAGGQKVPYRMATPKEIKKEWGKKFTTTAEQGYGQYITIRPLRRK